MDVVLRTHTDDPYLALRDVTRYADGHGICARIAVRSRGWTAEQHVCFHPAQLEAFVTAIARMDRTLRGTARLTSGFEDHYVELEVDHMGGVWVSGELFEYAQQSQHLRFGFRTDQTCLGPLADDLQACLHMPAT